MAALRARIDFEILQHHDARRYSCHAKGRGAVRGQAFAVGRTYGVERRNLHRTRLVAVPDWFGGGTQWHAIHSTVGYLENDNKERELQ